MTAWASPRRRPCDISLCLRTFLAEARRPATCWRRYRVLDREPLDTPAVLDRYDLIELPPSPRSRRGGLLDRGWRSSQSLDVWTRKDGGCPRRVLEGPLQREWD